MPLDIDRILAARPQNVIHYFPSTSSTMIEAAKLVAAGAEPGTVVLAEEQTAGMGRLGRSWHSPPDVGIYCSVILKLPVPPASLPVAMLVLALATAEAIQNATPLACDLRWPNDVLVHEKKVAGILAQFVDTSVVAGIGINVNQTWLPDNLRTPASSLRMESNGRIYSREEIIISLLSALDSFCGMLTNEGSESILRAFSAASSYALNRRVTIEESGRKGITAGLDQNGFLLVRLDDGRIERVATGGIRPDH
jgi:BirA family biotin operon repressor/biotin-[acetyl-CoA-carboxylase] ligase